MNSSPENGDMGSSCEFNHNLKIFREIPVFASMPLQTHKVLAYLCTRETFEPGDYLFQQGADDGQAIYIIAGKVALTRTDDDGRPMTVTEFTGGDFLGGLSLLGPSTRLFSLEAVDQTICMVLARDKFQHAMEQFPEMMPKAVHALVKRIGDWDKHLLNRPDATAQKTGVSVI